MQFKNNWGALAGRVSLFPPAPSATLPSALDLYRRVWGDEPDSFQRPSNALATAFARGKQGQLALQCFVHPTRMDFDIRAVQPENVTGIPLISDMVGLRDAVGRIIRTIETGLPTGPISRVGLFYNLFNRQPDTVAANRAISSIIPSRYGLKLADEGDFIFQVNLPYNPFPSDTTKLNVVLNWSVQRIQIMTVTTTAGQSVTPSTSTESEYFTVASVSIDVNNAPGEVLTAARQSMLLESGQERSNRIQAELGLGGTADVKQLN